MKQSDVLNQIYFSNYAEEHKLLSEEIQRVILQLKKNFSWD